MYNLGQKGVAQLAVILILLIGLIGGVNLITRSQPLKLFSHASNFLNLNPKGSLDLVNNNEIAGWACDGSDYSQSVRVDFYDGPGFSHFIGSATAGNAREAGVASQCGGNNNHGFSFTTPGSLLDGSQHNIYAYGINTPAGNNPLLNGSPKCIDCTSSTNPEPKGNLDLLSYDGIVGWACDPSDYSQAIRVDFYDGAGFSKFIGSTTANLPRESAVGGQCDGSSNHGFNLPIPSSLKDGYQHGIYAYGINTPAGNNKSLNGNPKYIDAYRPISANPKTVSTFEGMGTTRITWYGAGSDGEVWVNNAAAGRTFFARGASGSKDYYEIISGNTVFTLYESPIDAVLNGPSIGSVTVVGDPSTPLLCDNDDDFTEFVRCSNNQAIYRCPGTNMTKAFGEPYASQNGCVPRCTTSCAKNNGQNCTNPRKANDECADYYQDESFTCHFDYPGPNGDGCADWTAER